MNTLKKQMKSILSTRKMLIQTDRSLLEDNPAILRQINNIESQLEKANYDAWFIKLAIVHMGFFIKIIPPAMYPTVYKKLCNELEQAKARVSKIKNTKEVRYSPFED